MVLNHSIFGFAEKKTQHFQEYELKKWVEDGTKLRQLLSIVQKINISLALLEYYVHSENIAYLLKEILVAKIEFPDDFFIEELKEFPEGWNHYPYSSETTEVFTKLSKDRNFFALRVPSTIVGLESNIILNPLYKDFGKVEVIEFINLPINERLKIDKRE